LLTYADVCWRMLRRNGGVLLRQARMLTYADVCWRMLAYAAAQRGGAVAAGA
jgi:hypothetical protein